MNYILKNENAVYYECGYSCSKEVFLKLGSESYFFTDGRFLTEAHENVKNAEIVEFDRRNTLNAVIEMIKKSNIKELLINPSEFSMGEFAQLSSELSIDFIKEQNYSQKKRIIKNAGELDLLKKAATLGANAFDEFANFCAKDGFGLNEKRLFNKAENIFKRYGELELSFPPILAINANAAKTHALPSDTILKNNDLLLLDAGVKYERYCSDRTRTTIANNDMEFSKEVRFKDKFQQKIYDIVRSAHDASVNKAKAGVKASDVDKAGRDVIEKAGYGKYFMHSMGHGVGLDIHELPILGSRSEDILEENMVFTIEPGIYFPGEFGVRMENTLIAKQNCSEIIS